MKTKFEGHVDLTPYIENADLSYIPSEEDVDESVKKALTKGKLVLTELGEDAEIQAGDVVLLHTESGLSKFNKAKVPVTVGAGLYDNELEQAIIGLKVGDCKTVAVKNTPVSVKILQIKRKIVPELTDELVEEQAIEDVHILTEYRKYYREKMMDSDIGRAMYEIMNKISDDYPVTEFDETDIATLGKLESDFYIELFQTERGVDLREDIPDSWKEDLHIKTLDEFIAMRHDWYQLKTHQSLLLLDILDLPCEGEYDPLLHYDAYSKMQMLMMKKLETELTRRKNHGKICA